MLAIPSINFKIQQSHFERTQKMNFYPEEFNLQELDSEDLENSKVSLVQKINNISKYPEIFEENVSLDRS